MPTLHLICGLIASGKTAFARRLEEEEKCIRFTSDEWMITLFGRHMTREEFDSRLLKCKEQIWTVGSRLLAIGVSVILDYGFWIREERDLYRCRGNKLGADVRLWHLPSSGTAELLERIEVRNQNLDDTTFEITPAMIEDFPLHFEEPTEIEKPTLVELDYPKGNSG